MLALFRVERALNCAIAYRISKPVPYFQKFYFCVGTKYNHKMVGGNNNKLTSERGKQKIVASARRPVSTQSNPRGDANVNRKAIGHVQVHGGSSSGSYKHSLSLKVGPSLFRFIKGNGGSMQKTIEEEMGIRIIFPSSRNDESIIIEGTSPESVARASERIQIIIDEAVKSSALDYSHFISLPLAIHPQLVDKLNNFQNTILEINDANTNTSTLTELGIDKSIFINPKTFHLTVLMLKLWNKERVDTAVRIFKGIEAEVIDALHGRPVSIRLKGLDCMKGSFAKARVLYAPVEVVGGEERLLHACKVITDAFTKGGLVLEKDAKHTLKLHATVMNARHRKRTNNAKKFDSFDARGVMEKYGLEDWGEYLIPEIHLSQRFKYDNNGYYHRCTSIPLPKNVGVVSFECC